MACYCSIVGRGFSSRLLVPRWWSSFWGVICPLFPVCFYFLLLLLYFTSLISISPLHAFCPLIYTPYCIPFELSLTIFWVLLFNLISTSTLSSKLSFYPLTISYSLIDWYVIMSKIIIYSLTRLFMIQVYNYEWKTIVVVRMSVGIFHVVFWVML